VTDHLESAGSKEDYRRKGHGFSRTVKGLRLYSLATEDMVFPHCSTFPIFFSPCSPRDGTTCTGTECRGGLSFMYESRRDDTIAAGWAIGFKVVHQRTSRTRAI